MSKNPIAWLAHPYGGDPANLARAKRWLRWCIRAYPEIDFAADWILWCEVLDDADPDERERGIRFDAEMVRRCDQLWLVGGAISAGMAVEYAAAKAAGKLVLDMLHLGAEPPTPQEMLGIFKPTPPEPEARSLVEFRDWCMSQAANIFVRVMDRGQWRMMPLCDVEPEEREDYVLKWYQRNQMPPRRLTDEERATRDVRGDY